MVGMESWQGQADKWNYNGVVVYSQKLLPFTERRQHNCWMFWQGVYWWPERTFNYILSSFCWEGRNPIQISLILVVCQHSISSSTLTTANVLEGMGIEGWGEKMIVEMSTPNWGRTESRKLAWLVPRRYCGCEGDMKYRVMCRVVCYLWGFFQIWNRTSWSRSSIGSTKITKWTSFSQLLHYPVNIIWFCMLGISLKYTQSTWNKVVFHKNKTLCPVCKLEIACVVR